jgi:hypothetical protein
MRLALRGENGFSCALAVQARQLLRRVSSPMTYQAGDYVYPADLPRRVLCRVACAEHGTTPMGTFQILTLEPLDGPWRAWPEVDRIIRLDADVLPVPAHDLWRLGNATRRCGA